MAEQGASRDLISFGRWALRDVTDLTPDAQNPRQHGRGQIRAIAKSIKALGFNAPVLIDNKARIICGHGRYRAALLLGLTQIPVVCLEHLSEVQARAYAIADNRLTDRSAWDDKALARHLKELAALALDFDIEVTGFEQPKIEVRIQSLEITPVDGADQFEFAAGPFVSRPGDLWILGSHRLYCASALDLVAYNTMLANEKAAAVFTDPPCNAPIDRLIPGGGKVADNEFPITADAMAGAELTDILNRVPGNLGANCRDGALVYIASIGGSWANGSPPPTARASILSTSASGRSPTAVSVGSTAPVTNSSSSSTREGHPTSKTSSRVAPGAIVQMSGTIRAWAAPRAERVVVARTIHPPPRSPSRSSPTRSSTARSAATSCSTLSSAPE
jgi:ParB-like nuclease domain